MGQQTIALSGELGSGKSSVAQRVAGALGARTVSTGEAQRRIAGLRGISTLELNRLSEHDPTVDEEIDSVFRSLATVDEPLVVDSRLAWHFLPEAFAVHLVVDPREGARRALERPAAATEQYRSLSDAQEKIGSRVESERRRFLTVYGVDIFRLRNYHLVIDTSQADADEVAGRVVSAFRASTPPDRGTRPGELLLAPRRVIPTTDADAPGEVGPLGVGYRRPAFVALSGHRTLADALAAGDALVAASLVVEDGDEVTGAVPWRDGPDRRVLDRWEAAYGVRYPGPGPGPAPERP
jgi:predicted cytidylate kinase